MAVWNCFSDGVSRSSFSLCFSNSVGGRVVLQKVVATPALIKKYNVINVRAKLLATYMLRKKYIVINVRDKLLIKVLLLAVYMLQ
jgi:hypothetical protein